MCTDDSKISDQAGSGIYIDSSQEKLSVKKRTKDFSPVFRSEPVNINRDLKIFYLRRNIVIFGFYPIAVVYDIVGDKISVSILHKMKHIAAPRYPFSEDPI
ncbi:hypothetical protein TNCV_901701 [Trichonephila clavipes]|nr:hypothetical protein TNCV_901701 [Trichonephila clavipes]